MKTNKTLEDITKSLCSIYMKDTKKVIKKTDLYLDLHLLVKLCEKQNPKFNI